MLGRKVCSVSLDLSFRRFEAGAPEEDLLPGPVELHMETKKKQSRDEEG